MAIAPKLQQRQSQSLVMTPQLQQAIKLLQLSNIELAAFVEEQLESNPLLERGTGDDNRREEAKAARAALEEFKEVSMDTPSAAEQSVDVPDHVTHEQSSVADVGGSVDWSKAGSGGSFNGSDDYNVIENAEAELTLQEHLIAQLGVDLKDEKERLIGRYLIDHVDENGYLRISLSEASERLNVTENRLQSVLTQLQGFDPTGVCARDLKECLALQLRERKELDKPMGALLDNLPLLAKHDLGKLAKLCALSKDDLMKKIAALRSLAPKPGLKFGSNMAAAIEPDVIIKETPNGGWAVELNSDTLPRVLVNNRYFAEIMGPNADDETRTFMSECQQNASWLVKSLDQRARTILKVATEIVKQQDGFFAYGIDHMRPLNLKTVADAIEMHESTVSRVTTNKYMNTPRGLLEFKYFFTAGISALDGGDAYSAEAVRHKIKILISEETAKTVKSDDKLVKMLQAQGVDVARRTVAKYRESLGIPSSVERRRIFKHGTA
ncbi:MAG: RNA polymerase factor sigma-54 [Hellea sp.]|nr:RNA polymerase factor sigma-54 [Hellea sp.]